MSSDWNEAECYLAVWSYDQLDIDREQVKRELYRQVSDLIGRSDKAIEYKVQNVAHFDDRPREEKPISEAPHAQALLGKVFSWYWADRAEARSLFPYYVQRFQFGIADHGQAIGASVEKDSSELIIEEGAIGFSVSSRRRRSHTLLKEGRQHFRGLDPEQRLRCASCSFAKPFGIEKEIVQLHHTEPLYDYGEHGKLLSFAGAISKLVPLCPTCHQIAHTTQPPLSVEAITDLRAS